MFIIFGILLFALAVFALWYLDYKEAQAMVKENEEFREAISNLPVDKQIEMMAAKLRYDAEKDLH